MMTRRDKMNDDFAKVQARLGKTTGASKGSKPAPKAKTKPIIGKGKVGFKVTKKF